MVRKAWRRRKSPLAKIGAVPVVLGCVVLLAAGCGGGSSTSSTSSTSSGGGASTGSSAATSSAAGETLNLQFSSPWTNFDIQSVALEAINQLAFLAYDQPFALLNGKIIPYAGTMVKKSPTAVSFKLKSGITCTDGHVMTAQDAARSLNRAVLSQSRQVFYGAGPLHASGDDSSGVVTLKSKSPWNQLDLALAQPASSLVCPSGLDALKKDPKFLQTHFAGSGPYQLTSNVAGASATFKLRPNWTWGPAGTSASKGMPGTVKFVVTANPTTMANNLLTGPPSVAQVAGPDTARLNANSSILHKQAVGSFVTLTFNMRPGHVTDDVVLRQALGAATDRKAYIQASLNGAGVPVTGAFAPNDRCYDASAQFPPGGDIDAAKKILTDGGYSYSGGNVTKDGKPVHVNLLTSTAFAGAGEYLQAQWKKLGIDVSLQNPDFVTYNTINTKATEDAAVIPLPYYYPNPTPWAGYLYGTPSPEGINRGGNTDPKYTALFNAGFSAPAAKECAAWSQLQQYIAKTAPFVGVAISNSDFYGSGGFDFETESNQFMPAFFQKK